MSLLDYFRNKPKTANIAKQRLELLIAHRHSGGEAAPDYLEDLQRDVINVIRRYVPINDDQVQVNFERNQECDMLELNVSLAETETHE